MSIICPTSVAEAQSILMGNPEQAWAPEGAGGHGASLPPAESKVPALSMKGMQRVLCHRADELVVVVEAGISIQALQAELASKGQWIPMWDERQQSSLGGMLASDRTGPWRAAYGRLADRVLWAQVLLADGKMVESGAQVVKSVAGYDWARLLIGSQGGLGLVTAVALKTAPWPQNRLAWELTHPTGEALLPPAQMAWAFGASALEFQRSNQAFWQLQCCLEGHPMDLKEQLEHLQQAWPSGRLVEVAAAEAAWAWPQDDWEGELRWQSRAMAWPDADWLATLETASHLAWSSAWGEWRARFSNPVQASRVVQQLRQHARSWSWRLNPTLEGSKQMAWRTFLGQEWWALAPSNRDLLSRLKQLHDPQDRWQKGRFTQAVAKKTDNSII